jgi:hypothetical protein
MALDPEEMGSPKMQLTPIDVEVSVGSELDSRPV